MTTTKNNAVDYLKAAADRIEEIRVDMLFDEATTPVFVGNMGTVPQRVAEQHFLSAMASLMQAVVSLNLAGLELENAV